MNIAQKVMDHRFAGLCPDALAGWESRDPDCPACIALDALAAPTRWEYGWRSFFASGAEWEWLACSSREDAVTQIKDLQEAEDAARYGEGHLMYSLWRREVREPGPWLPVPADETERKSA